MRDDVIKLGVLVPGLPHPLLCPEKNKGWQNIRNGFDKIKEKIEEYLNKNSLENSLLLVVMCAEKTGGFNLVN